jgi:DNA replication and repair protein RecF
LRIERIKIENLRNIDYADISPHKKINIIIGNNGAGKTTLLESIYLLARAKSFRQKRTGHLIKEGTERLNLFATLKTVTNARHQIGLQKSSNRTEIKKDGAPLNKLSELAKTIPLTIITPNIQHIIEDDPKQRRRLLNWGLFHVEHDYGALAYRYKKTLIQRNNALRGSTDQLKVWDKQLVQIGGELDKRMSNYCEKWNISLNTLIETTQLVEPISLHLKRGWREEETLLEALERTYKLDRERGYTSCGPHRSDIKLVQKGKQIKSIFSRGEAKITAVLMLLSQINILSERSGELPLLLADDLHSELDTNSYFRLLKLIDDLKLQSFITTLDLMKSQCELTADAYQLFHVEHGEVSNVKL